MNILLRLLTCIFTGFVSVSIAQQTVHYHADGTACSALHMEELMRLQHPEIIRKQQDIDEATRRAIYGAEPSYRSTGILYTIPVVMHVVHFSGTAVGVNENISDAQIQAGINHMNDAFRNVGFYDPLTGADIEIEFCLASQDPLGNFTTGINRIANNALSDLDMDTEENTLKATITSWDPLSYCNIWLVDEICSSGSGSCGTAGYAYLASSHGQPWDGIVNEARFFGSSQNNSKVHIHEMGHYLNLSHTFDGCTNNDCTTDGDQVCDTPPDNSTTAANCFSSPAPTPNSCTTDEDDTSLNNPFRSIALGGLGEQNDMYQNYMDYGFQSCQDRFTEGQKSRMRTALTGPRASLLSSQGCVNPSTPAIYFSSSLVAVSEANTSGGSNCTAYRDVVVSMEIASAPTGDADISINYAGSAQSGSDYDPGTAPQLTFPSGSTAAQTFTIRIFDDAAIEGAETILLTYTISGSTDAVPAITNQSMEVAINDDDQLPNVAGKLFLLNEDFSAGIPASWNFLNFGGSGSFVWRSGSAGLPGTSAYISTDGGASRADDSGITRRFGMAPTIDATAISQDMILEFDLDVGGAAGDDFFELFYNVGTGWFIWQSPIHSTSGTYSTTIPTAAQGTNFQIGFIWNNNGDGSITGNVPSIDNVKIFVEDQPSKVETTVCNNDVPFGPNSTVYVYNDDDNDLVARITNLSNWDYGCTSFEIDRVGSSAQMYTNPNPNSFITDKTLRITPTNNNPSGNYEIRLYYSASEIAGWEAATGESRSNLTLFKASDPIPSASGLIELGASPVNGVYETVDYFVQAEFTTGFSGFAAHSQNATPLPIELLNFEGQLANKSVTLNWTTATELSNDYFEVEHSTDGINFEIIGRVASKGDSQFETNYQLIDPSPVLGYNYYRLKQTDIDGTEVYAGQTIVIEYADLGSMRLEPNPVRNGQMDLFYPVAGSNTQLTADILSIDGRLIQSHRFNVENGVNRIHFNVETLGEGVYILRTSSDGIQQANFRFVIMH